MGSALRFLNVKTHGREGLSQARPASPRARRLTPPLARAMALTIERCVGEFRGMLTEGIFPTANCLKFAVSKGLVRRARRRPDPAPRHAPNPPLRATPLVAPAP